MKAVILAGGLGTRLSEETRLRPKPMVEIGGRPIIWHIMKIYYAHGVRDFVVCLGYRGYMIKEYFANYALHLSDVTINLSDGTIETHRSKAEDWRVTLLDTGENAMTGARVRKILPFIGDDAAFCLTYGDGVADVDIAALIGFHNAHGKTATVTAVAPPGRFGALSLSDDGKVDRFVEKPVGDGGLINGGFFVLSPDVARFIPDGDDCVWEQEPLRALSNAGELMAYHHDGFWQPMDTQRDRQKLEDSWARGDAPWRIW